MKLQNLPNTNNVKLKLS